MVLGGETQVLRLRLAQRALQTTLRMIDRSELIGVMGLVKGGEPEAEFGGGVWGAEDGGGDGYGVGSGG